jgi:NarL family two-component system response regulator LiaR
VDTVVGARRTDMKVFVVDDHDLFRQGLASMLRERGINVVGDAALAADAIQPVAEIGPGVVLMDLRMPGMSGVEATQRLRVAAPQARVLVLTMMTDDQSVMNALLAGACGYVLKDAPIDQIIEGIRATARGESLISPRIASRLIRSIREPDEFQADPLPAEITPRELEVLELVAQGMDNATIAETLYVTHHTVKSHVASILTKLQVENRIQAAVRAVRAGLI